ncbi:MAG TPA: zinc-ribbon domain-containing protein [Ktedonobacteraceae bacterium]
MFCIQCGSYNPDNAEFCGKCGEKLKKGTSTPPSMPVEGVPASSGAQSPAGEYIPTIQEMPTASSFPVSQGTPPINDIPQTGYGISQSYPPPTYPTSDQYRSADMYNLSQSAYTQQSPSAIENYQTMPQIPPLQSNQPPYGHPGAPPIPPSAVRQPWYKSLSKPMPIWAFIGSILVVILLLIVVQVTGSDWAVGAMRVGIVAGILALVVVLVTGIRILLGIAAKSNPTRLIQLISAGLAILLLLLLSLVGLTQQSAIHGLQAHNWEGQQQWQSSINEYQLAGEGAPTSENIARVDNEWGEQFTAQQHYVDALAKYNIVLTYYGSASAGVTRAQSDSITAYFAWGQQASQQHDYMAATNHYDVLLNLPYCATTCRSQANALDATAYYNLAESQLLAKNYPNAINNFHILVSRFANSTEAHKVHGDYAKALFGEGKQQLNRASCTNAITTYQQLSTQFGDTPEGQQATGALRANQPVKGHFISTVPNNPSLTPIAALIQGLNHNMSDSQFFQLLSTAPTASIQSNGDFIFNPLPQGTYGLAWGTNQNNGAKSFQFAYNSDGSSSYVAKVGPLCPYDFGNLNETIPTS